MGEWPVQDSSGNTYQAYRDHFKWEVGLCLRDWRYTVRIANVDVTQLTGVSAANLINLIVRGLYRLPTAPANATSIQTSDTPEVRANMGRVMGIACRWRLLHHFRNPDGLVAGVRVRPA